MEVSGPKLRSLLGSLPCGIRLTGPGWLDASNVYARL